MAGSQRLLALLPVLLATALLAGFLAPAPSGAVLPPGANESLAAQAPLILIGKVTALKKDSGREVADFQVLVVGRGDPEPGRKVGVLLDRPPKKKMVGPTVVYHQMAPGQTWLLFLSPPHAKSGPYHTLAAHGWYTVKLDGIPNTAALLARLPQATHKDMEASLSFIREVYKGAGGWIEQGRK